MSRGQFTARPPLLWRSNWAAGGVDCGPVDFRHPHKSKMDVASSLAWRTKHPRQADTRRLSSRRLDIWRVARVPVPASMPLIGAI